MRSKNMSLYSGKFRCDTFPLSTKDGRCSQHDSNMEVTELHIQSSIRPRLYRLVRRTVPSATRE